MKSHVAAAALAALTATMLAAAFVVARPAARAAPDRALQQHALPEPGEISPRAVH
jgi:hypothetical protein